MGFQAVSNFFRQVPHYGAQTFDTVRRGSVATAIWAKTQTTHLVGPQVNRLHELYIEPLDFKDAIIFSVCGCVALTVMVTGIAILGKAFIAFSVVTACAILIVGALITKSRIESKFNQEAANIIADIIQEIRAPQGLQAAAQPDALEQPISLVEIERLCAVLRSKTNGKFEHLKEDLESFDRRLARFHEDIQRPTVHMNPQDTKNTFIAYLDGMRRKLGR